MKLLEQHQVEIQRNKESRAAKPLIRKIYADFYGQIVRELARDVIGAIVEIGSGSGELKERIPDAVCSDLFPNPWLDVVADGYRLPFRDGTVSNLVLLDVFHHLARPTAFLLEVRRVLARGGRAVLFEPYISLASWIVYGAIHHEPIAWRAEIDFTLEAPANQTYYAAQGNATRLFFRHREWLPSGINVLKAQAFSNFAYLLSGGLSKPALYPASCYNAIRWLDCCLSVGPRLFGSRCLVVLRRE